MSVPPRVAPLALPRVMLTSTPAVAILLPNRSASCTVTAGLTIVLAMPLVGCWTKTTWLAVVVLVSEKSADAVARAVVAFTGYGVPVGLGRVLAVNREAVAMPSASVVATSMAVPLASVTRAWSGVAKAV